MVARQAVVPDEISKGSSQARKQLHKRSISIINQITIFDLLSGTVETAGPDSLPKSAWRIEVGTGHYSKFSPVVLR
jgi:hypothetical protein